MHVPAFSTALAFTGALFALTSDMSPCVGSTQGKILVPPKSPPVMPPGAPSTKLWQVDAGTTRFGADIYRDVSCGMLERTVAFEWRYSTAQPGSLAITKAHTTESFGTEYWPTFVRIVDAYHLFVTGKAADGATILERWAFDDQHRGIRAPSIDTSCPEGLSTPRYAWTLPPRASVDEIVHLAAGSPQGLIRGVFRNMKSKERLFLYYDTSHELYSIDVKTHEQALIAGPTTSAPMQVMALAGAYRRFWEADYKQRGYCYFFGPEPGVVSDLDEVPRVFFLLDSDRDGMIDNSGMISPRAWSSEGWGDLANITPHDE